MSETTKRPELTLPEEAAIALSKAYAEADTILEYGSGGSTALAADLGKTVWSVESDPDWAQMMQDYFAQTPPLGDVHIVHCDIGATKEWGHPVNDNEWRNFARYPLAVWDNPDMAQPDVVLVDGRFRVGCALATAFRTKKPIPLYFDDYRHRERLHVIERYIGEPTEYFGRMARFDVNPTPIPAHKLLRVVQLMSRP